MSVGLLGVLAMNSARDPQAVFSPGEQLVFSVRALGFRAGVAQFDIGAAEPVGTKVAWPIVMVGRSEGMTDSVFPIRDRFVTFWDPQISLPLQAELVASEGSRKRTMSIFFRREPPAHADVRIHDLGKDPLVLSHPMAPNAQDFQAAIYWLRTRPLKPGDREEVPIVAGKHQWMMVAQVEKAAPLDVSAGHFDAVRVLVTTSFPGKLQSRGATVGYFSDDRRHLPLRLEADLALGKLVAELISFKLGAEPEP